MIEEFVTIYGYWKDNKEPIERLCKVDSRVDPNHKDHDTFIDGLDDDPTDDIVFYYFAPDEKIVGEHSDFVVYKFKLEGETV